MSVRVSLQSLLKSRIPRAFSRGSGSNHLSQVDGLGLEKQRIKLAIQEILNQNVDDLEGEDYIDKLTDEELAIAIRTREPRLKLYIGGHIDPFMFNYIRHNRPSVAAVEFHRRGG